MGEISQVSYEYLASIEQVEAELQDEAASDNTESST